MNVGPHEIFVEEDLLIARWRGTPSLAEVEEVMTRAEQVIRSHGFLYVLNDMRQAGPAGADARRYMQQWLARNPRCALASFGATPAVRVILYLITRAMVLLGRRPPVTYYLNTESEARTRISELRLSRQHASDR